MPYGESAKIVSLVLDGKVVEIKNEKRLNGDLNRSLLDDKNWDAFVSDPKSYTSKYGLVIDDSLSNQLHTQLKGLKSIDAARTALDRLGWRAATVWAVAAGAYSVSSSKVAVAFRGGGGRPM